LIMRVTSCLRAVIRTREKAMEDMGAVVTILKQYGLPPLESHLRDTKPFTISLTPSTQRQGHPMMVYYYFINYVHLADIDITLTLLQEIFASEFHPRVQAVKRCSRIEQTIGQFGNTYKWWMHRRRYEKLSDSIPSEGIIAHFGQNTLKIILTAMKDKSLSSLAPVLLDDRILRDADMRSGLSSLTNQQLSSLEISEDDFVGVDGIVNTWRQSIDGGDHPSALFKSIQFGKNDRHRVNMMTYSVDMMAILRKKILISHKAPTTNKYVPTPKSYGSPTMKVVYATVELAHLETTGGQYTHEPFLHNFIVHSF
ncbi:hypothetical protein PMAYCL1PPCAC_31105, partial [Pristionchus mayeri]